MITRSFHGAAAALAVVLSTAMIAPGVRADGHDSNTLHKIGKAIQYPVRKAGENTSKTARKTGKAVQYPVRKAGEHASVATHRATGKNSVIRRRPQHKNVVVKPSGATVPAPR